MNKIIITVVFISALISCNKVRESEEFSKAAPPPKSCYSVCNVTKNPDLTIITNAQDQPQINGVIDSSTYFWTRYHVRTHPVHLTQNYVTPLNYVIRYGWDSGVVVNRVQLQCLIENIAPFNSDCSNDWEFNESQGYLSPLNNYFFDGLFEFDTYEKGNGNNWKFLYTDFKKEFFPSSIPNMDYVTNIDFCYYSRGIPAQMGDFYYNYFRLPNRDGIYKIVIKFNPQIKGCRAVKETNYENNEETVTLEIREGTIKII